MTSTSRTLVANTKIAKDDLNSTNSCYRDTNLNVYEPPQIAYDRPSLIRQTVQVFAATMYLESATPNAPALD